MESTGGAEVVVKIVPKEARVIAYVYACRFRCLSLR